MSHFAEDHIDLRLHKDGIVRTTLSELNYYSDLAKEMIIVRIGLNTDLGSIPRALRGIFPNDGMAVLAYVLHDYLYKTGQYSRSKSDSILEEAMEVLGVSWWRRKSVHAGLKVGGWVAWNRHRKNDKKE